MKGQRMRWLILTLLAALTACGHTKAPARGTTVMTYNLLFEAHSPEHSLEVIQKESPDIVCLQELTPDFADRFQKQLGSRYPHRVFYPAGGTWGIGVASKHPLSGGTRFQQLPYRMPAAEARVRLGDRSVLVSCVHLFPPVARRRPSSAWTAYKENAQLRLQQAQSLVERYAKEQDSVLILGDMNEEDGDEGVKQFAKAGYRNACVVADDGCGDTWPAATSNWPAFFEVDHIWGRGVTFRGARRIKSGRSDHYPVMTSFEVSSGQ